MDPFAIGGLLLISCSLEVLAILTPRIVWLQTVSVAFFAVSLGAFFEIAWRYLVNLRQELRPT